MATARHNPVNNHVCTSRNGTRHAGHKVFMKECAEGNDQGVGINGILRRAADSWQLLTPEEKAEYTGMAGKLSIEAFQMFLRDYLRMSGLDITDEIRNKEKVLQ